MQQHRPRRGIEPCALASGAGLLANVCHIWLGKTLLAAFLVGGLYGVIKQLALLFAQLHARTYALGAPAVFAVVAKQARV